MNKKLTKLLSIFLIAGAIGAGAVGITACNKGNTPSHDVHIDADGDGKCDNGGEDFSATPTAITVNPSAFNVLVGGTVTFSAAVTGDDGKPSQEVTYDVYEADGTTATNKATISGNTLTAAEEGTVAVIATSSAKNDVKSAPVTITIRANTKFGEISSKSNNLISEDFEGTFAGGKLPTYTDDAEIGVYGRATSDASWATSACTVTVENGEAKTSPTSRVENPENSKETSNTQIVVNFGPVSGVVEGYFEFKAGALTDSGGNSVRFTNAGADVFQIFPKASGKAFDYLDSAGQSITGAENVITSTTNLYKVYFKIDTATGKLTLEIDGKAVFTGKELGLTMVDGFYLTTSNGSQRSMTVDNIAVAANTLTVAEYKTVVLAQITAEAAKYPTVEGEGATYTINKAAVDAAVAAANSAVNASGATFAQMQEAVATLKTTLAAIENDATVAELRQTAITAIKTAYPAYKYAENKSDYDVAIEAAETAINAATRATTITAAKEAAETQLDAIDDDETVVAAYKASLAGTLAAYKPAEVDSPLKPAIDAAVEAGNAKLEAATTKAACDKAIKDAKAAIDEIYESNDKEFGVYQQEVIDAIDAYTTEVTYEPDGGESTARADAIAEIKTTWKNTVNAMTEQTSTNADLSKALSDAKAAIDEKASEFAIIDYFLAENDKLGEWLGTINTHENEAYADAIINATEVDTPESKPEDFKTIASVDALITKVKADVQKVVDEWTKENNQKLTVTFANTEWENGKANFGYAFTRPATDPTKEDRRFVGWFEEDLTTPFDFTAVRYGDFTVYAVWREADVTIKLYTSEDDDNPTIIKAFSGEDPSTTVVLPEDLYESAMKFEHWYEKGGDATVAYTLPASYGADAEVELVAYFRYKTNEELAASVWYAVDDDVAVGSAPQNNVIKESNLFVLSTDDSMVYAEVTANVPTLNSKSLSKALRGSDVSGNATMAKNVIVTAKENIIFKVYVGVSAKDYNGNRSAECYVAKKSDRSDEANVGTVANGKNIVGVAEFTLKAGETAYFYIKNGGTGGGFVLYAAEATVDVDSLSNVNVEILNSKGEKKVTKSANSINGLTAPDADDIAQLGEEGVVTGWSYKIGDGDWTAITEWSAVPHTVGSTVLLMPTVQEPDVTVTYMIRNYDDTQKKYTAFTASAETSMAVDGETISSAPATEPELEGCQFAGWYTDEACTNKFVFGTTLVSATVDGDKKTYTLYAGYVKPKTYMLDSAAAVAAGIASGGNTTSAITIADLSITMCSGGGKITNVSGGYLQIKNVTFTITTHKANVVVTTKFQGTSNGRGINVVGKADTATAGYSQMINMDKTADQVITLVNAGTYTFTFTNNDVKIYSLTFTDAVPLTAEDIVGDTTEGGAAETSLAAAPAATAETAANKSFTNYDLVVPELKKDDE